MEAPTALHFQRCASCASAVHPPRPMCPVCGSRELGWEESTGHGTVYSTSDVHTRDGVHNVSLIDLDEGIRMMSSVPASLEIGERVGAFVDDDGRLVFAPLAEAM